jgi:hypothetical protein
MAIFVVAWLASQSIQVAFYGGKKVAMSRAG